MLLHGQGLNLDIGYDWFLSGISTLGSALPANENARDRVSRAHLVKVKRRGEVC